MSGCRCAPAGADRQRIGASAIDRALALVGLADFGDRMATQLVGRPAAACGARAQHRAAVARDPAGRTAEQSRCQAAHRHAQGVEAAAARARRDDDLRHPRPGRGDVARRRGLRVPRWPHSPARRAAGGLSPAVEPLCRRVLRQDQFRRGGRDAGWIRSAQPCEQSSASSPSSTERKPCPGRSSASIRPRPGASATASSGGVRGRVRERTFIGDRQELAGRYRARAAGRRDCSAFMPPKSVTM